MLTLSLVRHGQTEYNAESRLQGWCDSPLTARGMVAVRATADHLADRPFGAAYVSPAGRAQGTAHAILVRQPQALPVTDPDLREFGFGDLEARPEAELAARYDADVMFDEVLTGTFAGVPGGGESGPVFLARVRRAFERIERRHPDGHVLVVSHGLTLRAYLMMIDPRPMVPLPNASVSTVQVHGAGRRRVVAVGLDPAAHGVLDAVGPSPEPAFAR